MHISFNQIITLPRADTADIYLSELLYDYAFFKTELNVGDKLYLGIREPDMNFENAILKKIYVVDDIEDDIVFHLRSDDTVNMHTGKYFYSIKHSTLKDEEVIVTTIIQDMQFYIE